VTSLYTLNFVSMKKFLPKTDRYSTASKTIKCKFCDFTCPARGMSNHVARVHGIKKVAQNVTVLPAKNIIQGSRNIIRDSKKIIVTDRETIDYETMYAPICLGCDREITGSVYEGYVKTLYRNGQLTTTKDFRPGADFFCDECFHPGRHHAGRLEKFKKLIDAGELKFERVSFDRVMQAVTDKTALLGTFKKKHINRR
jgi:hypothetical protein